MDGQRLIGCRVYTDRGSLERTPLRVRTRESSDWQISASNRCCSLQLPTPPDHDARGFNLTPVSASRFGLSSSFLFPRVRKQQFSWPFYVYSSIQPTSHVVHVSVVYRTRPRILSPREDLALQSFPVLLREAAPCRCPSSSSPL